MPIPVPAGYLSFGGARKSSFGDLAMRGEDGIRFFAQQKMITERWPEPGRQGPLSLDPHVELQDGAVKRDYLAREVNGDEKAIWWARAVATWPAYAKYQTKSDRQIPVFVLEPTDSP